MVKMTNTTNKNRNVIQY